MRDPGHEKLKGRSEKLNRGVEMLSGLFQRRETHSGERNEVSEGWGSKGMNTFYFCLDMQRPPVTSPSQNKAQPRQPINTPGEINGTG